MERYKRIIRILLVITICAALTACIQDYEPPQVETAAQTAPESATITTTPAQTTTAATTVTTTGTQTTVVVTTGAQTTQRTEYEIADLSEMAEKSIVYIEIVTEEGYSYLGSGFVISSDGLIVTNHHVLEGAVSAVVEIDQQRYTDVHVLAYSQAWDLAVIRVNAKNLPVLTMADDLSMLRLGESVLALGNPSGYKATVSDGIVSTVARQLPGYDFDFIQTTAPISKGSSGGPLMNRYGEVIGVNTLTDIRGQNLNFAVPITLVHRLMQDMGESRPIGDVFSAPKPSVHSTFDHTPGEFAVVLSWEGNIDLDLEIWSLDFEYLGAAYQFGYGHDVVEGGSQVEWVVFDHTWEDDRYLISVYYHGPFKEDGYATDAHLIVYTPNGETVTIEIHDLTYTPPYDQWFGIVVDRRTNSFKHLDLYIDAPLVALLEWDTDTDVDILVHSSSDERAYTTFDFVQGKDVTNGLAGIETFYFGENDAFGDMIDLTEGFYDILIFMHDLGDPVTHATLTLVTEFYEWVRFSHTFTPDDQGRYVWYAVADVQPLLFNYATVPEDEQRLYLD